jgi:hypothetical protein
MIKWVGIGVGGWVSSVACGALTLSVLLAGCGDDSSNAPGGGDGGGGDASVVVAGNGGATPIEVGQAGAESEEPMGGSGPVAPADLVCKHDDDCSNADKPVCDQVKGCVACQFDWDCPAAHRCRDNQCFEKQPCSASSDCKRDQQHPVCDAVQQLCVGCREDADCGKDQRCEASECVAFEACSNSRDCTEGKVCDRLAGACVACVVDGDCGEGSACVHNSCVPSCRSDKECLGLGLLCNQSVGRCVECLTHKDCPEQYYCGQDSHCTLDVCEQGQTRCDGVQRLATCSLTGDTFVASSCDGASRCVEGENKASCVPLVCSPGGLSCTPEGDAVAHCSDDGLSVAKVEPCGEGTACVEGSCVNVICPPGAAFCDSGAIYQCNANGTARTLTQTCRGTFGATCDETTVTCKERTCSAGAVMCDGNVATRCADDGLGPQPGGTDCSATSQACLNGACVAQLCQTPYVCAGSVLQRCDQNGTRLTTVKDCGFPALCDQEGGKCIKATCTPGAFVCDGQVATRCKADGSGYVAGGVDCSATNLVCDAGGCLPKTCTPSSTFCAGGNPQKCSATGATYEATDVCLTSEYCSETSTYCLSDKCTAGAAICNGNVATTCASDGSGPVAGGTDCSASGKICEAGQCNAVVCKPGTRTCQGEAAYTCNPNGTGVTLTTTCLTSSFCEIPTSSTASACTPDICTAGTLGCNGEVISTCGANGGSWTSPGMDCKANSQVCVLGGTCAAEETATQGGLSSLTQYINGTHLVVFRDLTPRKLTKIEAQGTFTGLQKLTWVVYERRATAETYDLVYQKVTSQTQSASGPLASPALDFVFEKGKWYAVGLHIAGTASVAYEYAGLLAKGSFMTSSYSGTWSTSQGQPDTSLTPSSTTYRTYLKLTTTLAP